jgi:hypothetical protein
MQCAGMRYVWEQGEVIEIPSWEVAGVGLKL